MKLNIKKDATSKIISIFISDSSATDGSGLAGLVFNSAGLVARYKREGQSTWTTITLANGTLGTWSSGGFKEDTIAGGWYELGLPNVIIASATTVDWVVLDIRGATNMAPLPIEIQLVETVGFDKNTAFANFTFPMYNSNGVLTTGLTVTATRSIDKGVVTATTNAPTEVSNGLYGIDFSAADLNGNTITFLFSAAGARTTSITIVTNR